MSCGFLGVPLVETIADLINQIGFSLRDLNVSLARRPSNVRVRHSIPLWAMELAAISVLLVVLALGAEW